MGVVPDESNLCPELTGFANLYGADILHGAIHRPPQLPLALDFSLLAAFCAILFVLSLRNIRRKWIV
jgi:hypothetical protein